MKKIMLLLLLISGVSLSTYAQLPGNPINPTGVALNVPGKIKMEWELQGDSLYYQIDITTPNTFVNDDQFFNNQYYVNRNYLDLWAYNHNDDPWFPGSFHIEFDSSTFPYGGRTYYGVMDVSGYDPEWTSFSVSFGYLTGEGNDPIENSYYDIFNPFEN